MTEKSKLRSDLKAKHSSSALAFGAQHQQVSLIIGREMAAVIRQSNSRDCVWLLYLGQGHEVQPQVCLNELLVAAARGGSRLAFPIVNGMHLDVAAWTGPANADVLTAALVKSRYGISEPDLKSPHWQKLDLDTAHILGVFTPGLGFDLQFNRLGRGQGHYDRFLNRLKMRSVSAESMPLTVGITRTDFLLEHIPTETHDIKMDALFTERGRHCSRTWFERVQKRGMQ